MELKKNPTEFAQDYPCLIEKAEEYREELIAKFNIPTDGSLLNKSKCTLENFPSEFLMAQCIIDYGIMKDMDCNKEAAEATEE